MNKFKMANGPIGVTEWSRSHELTDLDAVESLAATGGASP